MRHRGVTMPLLLGLPGPVDRAKLLGDGHQDRRRRLDPVPGQAQGPDGPARPPPAASPASGSWRSAPRRFGDAGRAGRGAARLHVQPGRRDRGLAHATTARTGSAGQRTDLRPCPVGCTDAGPASAASRPGVRRCSDLTRQRQAEPGGGLLGERAQLVVGLLGQPHHARVVSRSSPRAARGSGRGPSSRTTVRANERTRKSVKQVGAGLLVEEAPPAASAPAYTS